MKAYTVFLLCAATALALPAQDFTTLHAFDGADGAQPYANLVQGADGNLYGTTASGGANPGPFTDGAGTIFKITPTGTLTTIYNFCSQGGNLCTDGYWPFAGLVQAADGDFYGTTYAGGAPSDFCYGGCGTVFKITPSGTLTTLHSFCSQSGCSDGASPDSILVQGTDRDFYGTTQYWGANGSTGDEAGTVFKITPSGTLTTLYSFCPRTSTSCTDGSLPGQLIQASNGDFYGTTVDGGANGGGTIFKITPNGTLTSLYSFCAQPNCTDGFSPDGLVPTTSGGFYGTTSLGGGGAGGSVFKLTPGGTLTTVYSFCTTNLGRCGEYPGGLVQATNGDFYGFTSQGGANYYYGTVFKVTPDGAFKTVHNFCSQGGNPWCADGAFPSGALMQATNGEIYGTTGNGGAGTCPSGCGVIFGLSLGLAPFVETQPAAGKVGVLIRILGTDLTGVSSVTFNGTPAVVGVSSAPGVVTEITTYVPAGATTGPVQVVTPSGTLSSNAPFRVLP